MADAQDPYQVSVHLIADPGRGVFLQHATDAALSWIHPDLRLFRVSERARRSRRRSASSAPSSQPALAVILFLQEARGGEEHALHRALQRAPWRFHHTEKVTNGKRMLPLTPCSQDFFTLSSGTPLWAVRQVHYGKEIVRLTLYCRHENHADMVRLYRLLLRRKLAQRKDDFCFFVVFSNADLEVQLALKRLQKGQAPLALDSAVMELRVRDVGALVPLLPHPCSPISDLRWQTQDYDGNRILLQVQTPVFHPHLDSSLLLHESCAPSTFPRHGAPYRPHPHHHNNHNSHSSHHHHHQHHHPPRRPQRSMSFHCRGLSQTSLALNHELADSSDDWPELRRPNLSTSVLSLPGVASARSPRRKREEASLAPPFRLNVDALIGAEETDVDTGDRVAGGVDLSVVSAYIEAGLSLTPRPLSAPPPPRSPGVPHVSVAYGDGGGRGVSRASSVNGKGNFADSDFGSRGFGSSNFGGCDFGDRGFRISSGRGQRSYFDASATASVSSVSINQSDSAEDEKTEEEEEFYI